MVELSPRIAAKINATFRGCSCKYCGDAITDGRPYYASVIGEPGAFACRPCYDSGATERPHPLGDWKYLGEDNPDSWPWWKATLIRWGWLKP